MMYSKSLPVLELLSQMCQVFVDTYLMVLLMLEQICGKRIIVKQKLMVNELHTALKNLYTDKVLPHLHSCLDEILWTSILRFEEMGFVEVNSYGNKQGSKTNFLISNIDKRPKLIETLELLQAIRSFSDRQMKAIDEEILNAVLRAQGPIPIAKL